jgi:hypothetical protein
MKKLIALVVAVAILMPGLAFAGASTDAALALGAFAVFNQIVSGVGVFHRGPVVAAPPVVYAPPPPVYAPARVYAPPPPVVYAPPPVIVRTHPVYAPAPRHVVVHRPAAFCPPGHAKKGWCHPGPSHHYHHHDRRH